MLFYTENEKQLFLSFQEYQKNKKMVPSLYGPKAPSALSLSATLVALVLCLSLRRLSNLFHCCSLRPVGISYNCPSPVADQDKSSGGATQKTQSSKKSQPQAPQQPEDAAHTMLCSLSKRCRSLVCSLWGGCLTLLTAKGSCAHASFTTSSKLMPCEG